MPMSKDEMRAYQQARRERRRAQTKNQAPEIEGAPPHSLTNVQADQLAAAQAEIEALQAEVAMLKHQLAERRALDRINVPTAGTGGTADIVQRPGALSQSTVPLLSFGDRTKRL